MVEYGMVFLQENDRYVMLIANVFDYLALGSSNSSKLRWGLVRPLVARQRGAAVVVVNCGFELELR